MSELKPTYEIVEALKVKSMKTLENHLFYLWEEMAADAGLDPDKHGLRLPNTRSVWKAWVDRARDDLMLAAELDEKYVAILDSPHQRPQQ